jgi:hypothetical protein
MSPSWLIDCRNTANPLIDYTARPDVEWRHVPNNTDKIDETHLQKSEYFYPGVTTKKWYIFFFSKHTFSDYFLCGRTAARKMQFITIEWKNQNIICDIYRVYLTSAKCVLYWIISVLFYERSSSEIHVLILNVHPSTKIWLGNADKQPIPVAVRS